MNKLISWYLFDVQGLYICILHEIGLDVLIH